MIKKYNPTDGHEQVHQLLFTYNKNGSVSCFNINVSGKVTGSELIERTTNDLSNLVHIQSERFFIDTTNKVNKKHVCFDSQKGRFRNPKELIFFDGDAEVERISIQKASKYLCSVKIMKHTNNGRMN